MRLVLAGDTMLGRQVNRALAHEPPEYPWGDVLPVLSSADAFVTNLECVISDRGEPWPDKIFVFRSDLKNVAVLERAGVTAVSLANNHALDMGTDALLDCLQVLGEHGIRAAGAGASLDAARRPAFFPFGPLTMALVAFTDNEPGWEASSMTPGVFYSPVAPADGRFRAVLELVAQAARQADLTVVSAHWGPNWGGAPLPAHVAAARLLVDAGADVVFGHSPHIVRGIGVHRGKPILYSCGDFVDDYAVDEVERNDESFVFALDFDGRMLRRLLLVPTIIRDRQARLAQGWERDDIVAKMRERSAFVGTDLREVGEGLELDLASELRPPAG